MVKNLPYGVGIGAVNLADGVVMIRVNEEVVVPFTSILSANQLRNYATKVMITLGNIEADKS